jgi:hypothetical protein
MRPRRCRVIAASTCRRGSRCARGATAAPPAAVALLEHRPARRSGAVSTAAAEGGPPGRPARFSARRRPPVAGGRARPVGPPAPADRRGAGRRLGQRRGHVGGAAR